MGQLPSTIVIVIRIRQIKRQSDLPESFASKYIQLGWSDWKIYNLNGEHDKWNRYDPNSLQVNKKQEPNEHSHFDICELFSLLF